MKLEALKSEQQKILEKLKYFPEFYLIRFLSKAVFNREK